MALIKTITSFFENVWKFLNKLHPETRSLIVILLFGFILYSQITQETRYQIYQKEYQLELDAKKAEQYSIQSAIEINNQIQLIAEKDPEAFDVLLLNYHNNTQSLQGYKYLYLSCLTEALKSLDAIPLKQQWNRIDYIYYADELARIHGQSFIQFEDVDSMKLNFPKLYRLVIASEAKSISFFTIEGPFSPIGLVIILYKESKRYNYKYAQNILPCIQRLAILLDYEKQKK